MKKKVMMVLGTVGALAIGLFAVGAVGAQEADDLTRPLDNLVSRVADKLGISEDEFVDVWNDSASELVTEGIEAGDIDPERGAALLERIEESDGIFTGPRHERGQKRGGHMVIGDAATTVLGLEEGELCELRKDGQSLLDVALANGFTEEQFTTDLLAEVQSTLDEKVAAEDIDQVKADEIYTRISDNIDEIINHTKGDETDRPVGFGPRGFGPRHDAPETDVATTDI
ncbi:MAG: hypothetical protein IH957_06185 [Chloroflexi bacterium]|nr:hypothetical protein [Chloroflexota bacterium]